MARLLCAVCVDGLAKICIIHSLLDKNLELKFLLKLVEKQIHF